MKIELHQFTIGEVVEGYRDSDEEGVVGYGGRLNIRPKYQREFVYDAKKQMVNFQGRSAIIAYPPSSSERSGEGEGGDEIIALLS